MVTTFVIIGKTVVECTGGQCNSIPPIILQSLIAIGAVELVIEGSFSYFRRKSK